jgi:hypothetical protein
LVAHAGKSFVELACVEISNVVAIWECVPHRNARISPIRNPVVVAGRMIVRVGSLLAATSRRTSSARRNLRGRFKALSYISTPRKGLFKT